MPRALEERESFVRTHAALAPVPLVPEVRLYLAGEVTPLWHATEPWLRARDVPPPFWAFAWAGGQALARWILDAPGAARGKSVLDFASGSGLVAIAAARAGAARVVAVDIDPLAEAACALNARANGSRVEVVCADALEREFTGFDVVTAGDVWYEARASARFEAWLRGLAARGARVVTGDPGRAYAPKSGARELARYDVPTPLELEGKDTRATRVMELFGA